MVKSLVLPGTQPIILPTKRTSHWQTRTYTPNLPHTTDHMCESRLAGAKLTNLCIYSCFFQGPCVFIRIGGHWAPSWKNTPPILLQCNTCGKLCPFERESQKNTSSTGHCVIKWYLLGWIQMFQTSSCIYIKALTLPAALCVHHFNSSPVTIHLIIKASQSSGLTGKHIFFRVFHGQASLSVFLPW